MDPHVETKLSKVWQLFLDSMMVSMFVVSHGGTLGTRRDDDDDDSFFSTTFSEEFSNLVLWHSKQHNT